MRLLVLVLVWGRRKWRNRRTRRIRVGGGRLWYQSDISRTKKEKEKGVGEYAIDWFECIQKKKKGTIISRRLSTASGPIQNSSQPKPLQYLFID